MSSFEHNEIKARIHHYLVSKTNFLQVKDTLQDNELRSFVNNAIDKLCQESKLTVSLEDRLIIIRELASSVISLGPLRPLVEDPAITEIMVNGCKTVYIQKAGKIEKTDVCFPDNSNLMHTIQKIISASGSSRRVDESSPYVDFSMADGSRVNVILPPCSMQGPILTIRKFSRDLTTLDDLMAKGTLNKQMAMLLIAAIKGKLNVIFCGSTGSGKTTLLNVLSSHIPGHERIITIEDTSELRLMQQHVVSLQAKPSNLEGKGEVTMQDLFVNSLRMRPDRLIIGEVRGAEILDLVQSISSGHSGSLAIVHADSPAECFNRMVTMMLMSGIRLSGVQIEKQLATSIDMIVYVELFMDGVRRIVNITDLSFDKESGKTTLEDIFTFKQEKVDGLGKVIGDWVMNKRKPSFYQKFVKRNIQMPDGFFV